VTVGLEIVDPLEGEQKAGPSEGGASEPAVDVVKRVAVGLGHTSVGIFAATTSVLLARLDPNSQYLHSRGWWSSSHSRRKILDPVDVGVG